MGEIKQDMGKQIEYGRMEKSQDEAVYRRFKATPLHLTEQASKAGWGKMIRRG